MTFYMIYSGTPALYKVGIKEILFSNVWNPTSSQFGIMNIIFTSIIGSAGAILIGVPVGLLTADFFSRGIFANNGKNCKTGG